MSIEVMPTYENVLRVWWAYSWRWFVCGVVVGLIASFVVRFTGQLMGLNVEVVKKALIGTMFIISVLVAPQWSIHRILTKGFGRFRLAMVEK